jgi:Xaa-Pro aminopeptidase
LIIAASVNDADLLYATGFFVPDPFIFMDIRGSKFAVLSDLEIDRGRRSMKGIEVLSLTALQQKAASSAARPRLGDIAAHVLKSRKIRRVSVPGNFPLFEALLIEEHGITVEPVEGSIYPERDYKSSAEIRHIRAALKMTEAGIQAGREALRKAVIGKGNVLMLDGARLTSEKLRAIIDGTILELGGIAEDTIVACGNQGCDPHERGHGPLRAHQPIIVDVFPRMTATGYHGDITRTFVKGTPKPRVAAMYEAVYEAQMAAIDAITDGADSFAPHKAVCDVFEKRGFETSTHPKTGVHQGFFHGTGHGLGLEVHEMPRMGRTSQGPLEAGHVVTVEPGLYYPGFGGVRLEDVVVVTNGKARNLVDFEKELVVQ